MAAELNVTERCNTFRKGGEKPRCTASVVVTVVCSAPAAPLAAVMKLLYRCTTEKQRRSVGPRYFDWKLSTRQHQPV